MSTKHPSAKTKGTSTFKDKLRPLGQRFRSDRKLPVLTIVLFAIVGVAGTLFANAAQLKDEQTVVLSNGKEIRLGQQVDSLSRRLGSDLYKLSDNQYQFPTVNQPIEVLIDVDRNRVVALHILNEGSSTAESNNRIGTTLQEVSEKNRQAKPATGELQQLFPKNLTIERSRSKEFVVADSCQDKERASVVAIALKGYEHLVTEYLAVGECYID